MKQEIKIQKKLSHSHIIKLINFFEDKYFIYLILEYASCGTLHQYIRKKKTLSEIDAFKFFFQICLALNYIHQHNIMHRDIKVFFYKSMKKIIFSLKISCWILKGMSNSVILDYVQRIIPQKSEFQLYLFNFFFFKKKDKPFVEL